MGLQFCNVITWVLQSDGSGSKKNLFRSGQKVSRSKAGWPLIYYGSKVSLGQGPSLVLHWSTTTLFLSFLKCTLQNQSLKAHYKAGIFLFFLATHGQRLPGAAGVRALDPLIPSLIYARQSATSTFCKILFARQGNLPKLYHKLHSVMGKGN